MALRSVIGQNGQVITPMGDTLTGALGYGIPAEQFGLQDLFRLLGQRGRTDPRLLNMNLAGIDRGTQQAQDATAGMAARSGLGGSGLLQAIQASQGQGGLAAKARLRAQDAAQADQNQRMNLQLLRDLVIGPGLDLYGIQNQPKAPRGNKVAPLLGAVASFGSSYFNRAGAGG